jgi:hypothetical protein
VDVPEKMTQEAPYPTILAELVSKVRYRDGWTFNLEHRERDEDHGRGTAGGLTLVIITKCTNSYHAFTCEFCGSAKTNYGVAHFFIVPAATYGRRSWSRWLFEQVLKVEEHECAEFFQLVDKGDFINKKGEHVKEHVVRPYAPIHAPGADPYTLVEYATDEERRTSFRGTLNES